MNSQMTNYKLQIANGEWRMAKCVLRAASPVLLAGVILIIFAVAPARAMPEYATRTGEPCATCHVSPAGGGLRNVRGQAWVLSGKPATVPSTTEALQILGIQLPADMSIYTAAPSTQPTPAPFNAQLEKYSPLIERLLKYEGN